jgi:pyruvate carboxylase
MRVIEAEGDLAAQLPAARREAASAFGNDEVYLEKLVRNARHVEVQVLGDLHGNLVHLFERDCTVQRRNQKVVERAPAPYLDAARREEVCEAALRLARGVGYTHAGTVEFLMDADTGRFHFIEVNPRVQVEHTVTEVVTGIDIVEAQIRITEGARIGVVNDVRRDDKHLVELGSGVPGQPEIRLDGGTACGGALITPYYDALLVKVTAWATSSEEAIRRMDRALRAFRVRGVATNLQFVENVNNQPSFVAGKAATRFIDTTPELLDFARWRDRASRLLRYIGEVTVNGHPDMKGRAVPDLSHAPPVRPTSARAPRTATQRMWQRRCRALSSPCRSRSGRR